MKFGCSECLCIAIESHRPALLKSLLQRELILTTATFFGLRHRLNGHTPNQLSSAWRFQCCIISERRATCHLLGGRIADTCEWMWIFWRHSTCSGIRAMGTFWCRFHWWRDGTAANGSMPSEFCGSLESSTTRRLSSFTFTTNTLIMIHIIGMCGETRTRWNKSAQFFRSHSSCCAANLRTNQLIWCLSICHKFHTIICYSSAPVFHMEC